MNGIRKKIMCLVLSLAFAGVSSQAQVVNDNRYSNYVVFSDLLEQQLNISPVDTRTIFKGLFMMGQDWANFAMLGIEDNFEKFKNGKISGSTASCGIFRNVALASGLDSMRGAFTLLEMGFGDRSLEKGIEGVSYIAKGLNFTTEHNWYIGYGKMLTLASEEFCMPSSFIFYSETLDLREELKKTCKLTEAWIEISPLYNSKKLFYRTKGTNKIVEGTTSAIFLDKVDPTGFVILNRGVRRFIYDVNIYLIVSPIPIVALGFFAFCQCRLVNGLTSGVTDSSPMLTLNDRKSLDLEIFKNAISNFKKATELDLEENDTNIVKTISLYRSALIRFKDCASLLKDTQKKKKSKCQYRSMRCLEKIKHLIGKFLIDEPDDQKSSSIYANCMKRIVNAEDDIQIKDVLIEYKNMETLKSQKFWMLERIFSSNSVQLDQLIDQL